MCWGICGRLIPLTLKLQPDLQILVTPPKPRVLEAAVSYFGIWTAYLWWSALPSSWDPVTIALGCLALTLIFFLHLLCPRYFSNTTILQTDSTGHQRGPCTL